MRKNILYLITATLLLSSCWTNRYEAPPKTKQANKYYAEVKNAILTGSQIINIAYKVNMWASATTESDKELIEDAYFINYKLRVNGDTIRVNSGNSTLYTFVTRGNSLNDANAQWTLILINEKLDIKRVTDNKLHITNDTEYFAQNKYDLTFMKTDSNWDYTVSGSGYVKTYKCSFYELHYTIKKDMIISNQSNNKPLIQWDNEFVAGEIQFWEDSNTEKATATIHSKHSYTITYKGFTDNWPIF